jgi:cyclic pyranopterin phosphate synthase
MTRRTTLPARRASARRPAPPARAAATRRAAATVRRAASNSGLTHLDAAQRPTMVDVGAKVASSREAVAEARVKLPAAVARALAASGHRTRKGPVFDTAIIAGVQAVKRTHELIPFCHPLPIESCDIDIDSRRGGLVVIRCRVGVFHKTGVEMEALTGAVAAALTIYDMCKALGQGIVIGPARLLAKRGGRIGEWQAGP